MPECVCVCTAQFDSIEAQGEPWELCPTDTWCSKYQDRVSASLVSSKTPKEMTHYPDGAAEALYLYYTSLIPASRVCSLRVCSLRFLNTPRLQRFRETRLLSQPTPLPSDRPAPHHPMSISYATPHTPHLLLRYSTLRIQHTRPSLTFCPYQTCTYATSHTRCTRRSIHAMGMLCIHGTRSVCRLVGPPAAHHAC